MYVYTYNYNYNYIYVAGGGAERRLPVRPSARAEPGEDASIIYIITIISFNVIHIVTITY